MHVWSVSESCRNKINNIYSIICLYLGGNSQSMIVFYFLAISYKKILLTPYRSSSYLKFRIGQKSETIIYLDREPRINKNECNE